MLEHYTAIKQYIKGRNLAEINRAAVSFAVGEVVKCDCWECFPFDVLVIIPICKDASNKLLLKCYPKFLG